MNVLQKNVLYKAKVLAGCCLVGIALIGQMMEVTHAAVVQSDLAVWSVRVIAHSDHPDDQALKRAVRDAIVARMEQERIMPMQVVETQSVQPLLAHVVLWSQEVLREAQSILSIHVVWFAQELTDRTKTSSSIHRDRVRGQTKRVIQTVQVTIGAGQGRNWWCLLVKPWCVVEGSLVPATTEVSTASPMVASLQSVIPPKHPEKLQVQPRFWVETLWTRWRTGS